MMPPHLAGARILVVDDEPANVRLLDRILRGAGYAHVATTTDAREALPLVREFAPDLVLLDLHMPHLDGTRVLRQVREEFAQTYLPVLVLSADTLQLARNSVLRFGAQDFVAKPFDRTEVLLRVANLVHTRHLQVQLETQNERLEQQVRQRTRALEQALSAANAAAEAKSQFLANVGHELRTPVAALHGSVQLLGRMVGGTVPPPAQRMLEVAVSSTGRLVRAIEDVLALQELQTGSVAPRVAPVDLGEMVREACSGAERRCPGSVPLRMEVPDALPALATDGDRARDALGRLVENALRFTARGSVTVRAAPATGAFAACVEVVDTGEGIPEDRLEAIFQPFEQADNSDTRRHGGIGLGLTIARALCELLGAKLEVATRLGQGSTFRMLLPNPPPPATDGPADG